VRSTSRTPHPRGTVKAHAAALHQLGELLGTAPEPLRQQVCSQRKTLKAASPSAPGCVRSRVPGRPDAGSQAGPAGHPLITSIDRCQEPLHRRIRRVQRYHNHRVGWAVGGRWHGCRRWVVVPVQVGDTVPRGEAHMRVWLVIKGWLLDNRTVVKAGEPAGQPADKRRGGPGPAESRPRPARMGFMRRPLVALATLAAAGGLAAACGGNGSGGGGDLRRWRLADQQ
jgi:hypothetical protein